MVTYPPFGVGDPAFRIKDEAVDVSSAGNSDILFSQTQSVRNTGGSSIAFEKNSGIDTDPSTMVLKIIGSFNVVYPDLFQPGDTPVFGEVFNVVYPTLANQSGETFNVVYPDLTTQITEGFNK